MSWLINASGKKNEVVDAIGAQVETITYKPGTPEGDDVTAAAARAVALVDAMAGEEVTVNAYGSHQVGANGIEGASFSVSVSRSK